MTALLVLAAWVATSVVVAAVLARPSIARHQARSLQTWEADQLAGLLRHHYRAGDHYPTLVQHQESA